MSDPAKEPDIEDVLASVRRLVTAERRERPSAPSALVLTPSQRIERGSDVAAPPREGAPSDMADADWEDDEPQDAFDAWARENRPTSHGGLAAVPTIGDAEVGPEPAHEDDAPEIADEPEDEAVAEEWSIDADELSTEPEAAVEEMLDETGEDEDAPAATVAFRHAPDDGFGEADAPHGDEDYAEIEEVELDGVTDVDPDAVEDAEIVEAEGASEDDDFGDVVDEAALRAMVSEIVREELRGRLGERITSNVRKLVRREIHRILAARDFE